MLPSIMFPLHLFSAFAALVAAVLASSERRQNSGAYIGNTADDRAVWYDYDTSTDFYDVVPDIGLTREYWLEITNTTLGPDGIERAVLSVNGISPGSIIWACGDTVIVHVSDSLSINGSSIHWHVIKQNYTVQNDGVLTITPCPTIVIRRLLIHCWPEAEIISLASLMRLCIATLAGTQEGLAVQFIERQSEIPVLLDDSTMTDFCGSWNTFQASIGLAEENLGI